MVDIKIVPDDTLEHVVRMLKSVWQKQVDEDRTVASVYVSDNINKEKRKY